MRKDRIYEKNEIIIYEDHAAVVLTMRGGKSLITKIDVEDVQIVRNHPYRWHAKLDKVNAIYVTALNKQEGKKTKILLHRLLTGCPENLQVDHINHDTLDNRRSKNLRIVTNYENSQNRRGITGTGTSEVRGVYWMKHKNRWKVQLYLYGKLTHIGLFVEKTDAISASKKARESTLSSIKEN